MDAAFLDHYNQELGYLRQLGAEFAEEYPGVAGRLGMDGFHCQDPYVERLLEGFAFLAARVHRRIDAEFPEFTGGLLDSIYPQLTRPIPSAAILALQPDPKEGSLVKGYRLPRGTRLRSPVTDRSPTPVQMVTTRDTDLHPLRIADVRWIDRQSSTDSMLAGPVVRPSTRSLMHIRLETFDGLPVSNLSIDRLMLHWRGGEVAVRVLEKLQTSGTDVCLGWSDSGQWFRMSSNTIQSVGFGDDEWLLPPDSRTFRGYQWLQEYFLLPEKFLFTELVSLRPAFRHLSKIQANEPVDTAPRSHVDLLIALDDVDPMLADAFGPEHVALHCVPVVNLFSKRADRVQLGDHVSEHALIVDRSRPMDFEVWSIQDCHGHGPAAPEGLEYRPLYSPPSRGGMPRSHDRFYTVSRRARQRSERQRDFGHRSTYMGSEAWVTLTESGQTSGQLSGLASGQISGNPNGTRDLHQLSATVMCTNRDLVLCPPAGGWTHAFTLDGPGPVIATRILTGPTPPRSALASEDDQRCWRLVQHLQMEALPMSESGPLAGPSQASANAAEMLRDRLSLYCPEDVPLWRRQIDGIVALQTTTTTRQLPYGGRIVYGRGVDVDLHLDESAFESSGAFLFATILERFFALDTSLNTFIRMTVHSTTRGKIHSWPLRMGGTPAL